MERESEWRKVVTTSTLLITQKSVRRLLGRCWQLMIAWHCKLIVFNTLYQPPHSCIFRSHVATLYGGTGWTVDKSLHKVGNIFETKGRKAAAKLAMNHCKLLSLSQKCRNDICDLIQTEKNLIPKRLADIATETPSTFKYQKQRALNATRFFTALLDLEFCELPSPNVNPGGAEHGQDYQEQESAKMMAPDGLIEPFLRNIWK